MTSRTRFWTAFLAAPPLVWVIDRALDPVLFAVGLFQGLLPFTHLDLWTDLRSAFVFSRWMLTELPIALALAYVFELVVLSLLRWWRLSRWYDYGITAAVVAAVGVYTSFLLFVLSDGGVMSFAAVVEAATSIRISLVLQAILAPALVHGALVGILFCLMARPDRRI